MQGWVLCGGFASGQNPCPCLSQFLEAPGFLWLMVPSSIFKGTKTPQHPSLSLSVSLFLTSASTITPSLPPTLQSPLYKESCDYMRPLSHPR